jgi:hypothetical protein
MLFIREEAVLIVRQKNLLTRLSCFLVFLEPSRHAGLVRKSLSGRLFLCIVCERLPGRAQLLCGPVTGSGNAFIKQR